MRGRIVVLALFLEFAPFWGKAYKLFGTIWYQTR
jgi:hypothetical protein